MEMEKEVTETEFWDKFHEKHNPRYYYAKKKTQEKKTENEKKSRDRDSTKCYPFPQGSCRVD